MSAQLPFANDGSFLEQWQRAQAQQQQQQQWWQQAPQQQQWEQQAPAQPSTAAAEQEEGELTGQQAYARDYSEAAYRDAAGGVVARQDAYQWQQQEQYDAWPEQEYQQQYADAHQQLQQQQYEQVEHVQQPLADAAAAAAVAAVAAQPAEERDFNACDAWFGPWPGFCFKLGEQGLGYYRLTDFPPKSATAAAGNALAPEKAKPKVILGNNSIIKGLAPRAGGVGKGAKKKPAEEKPAYLREMEAWQKQSCSSDDQRRSLVK